MSKRRRYATRDELVAEISGRRDIPHHWIDVVFDGLSDLGVSVDALVKIEIEEPKTGGPPASMLRTVDFDISVD